MRGMYTINGMVVTKSEFKLKNNSTINGIDQIHVNASIKYKNLLPGSVVSKSSHHLLNLYVDIRNFLIMVKYIFGG